MQSGGSRKASKASVVDGPRRTRKTHEPAGPVGSDDEERFSDTRILVVADENEEDEEDQEVEEVVCGECGESDVDSV